MDEVIVPIFVCGILFLGLPWMILHYVTKWKGTPKITAEDENLLDEMFNLARRLEDRMNTVERIVAADNPDWKPSITQSQQGSLPQSNYEISRRN
ncbi:envelope stress response membrane protein PspB [Sphingomonas aracearum]|uniref:Envelope stress response membrane protein PspB n=1 Tax=Sphingomonas aracearum TaxID=2283317 RepID=A0A369VS52_9SPHN|nr:envelope stress response membrane protein PspB [Sphingomonas aracearum]RDE05214.1 envelope stress response membrane protein PspB [Sphingomonas aracearum]